MRFDYRIVFVITALLFILSISLTSLNYYESMNSTRDQLKTQSLPLTVDNIYTKIQKQIIEPNLIASVMSNDTFMKDWLAHEENDSEQIKQYLETIQTKYHMFTAFLVSKKSYNYYTTDGLLETISPTNKDNDWYFDFMAKGVDSEINIDYNKFLGKSLIMFINHKIYDKDAQVIGVTGVGLKTSYINNMLKFFRERYQFNVYLIDGEGQVFVSEQGVNNVTHLADHPELKKLIPDISNKEKQLFEYEQAGESFLLTKKYIAELGLYVVVEAKVDNFTQAVQEALYLNIIASMLITLIVTCLVIWYVRKIHGKLNQLASHDSLTGLPNRRVFNSQLERLVALRARNRQHLSVIFFDIDDFKMINDEYGHDAGDEVLIAISAMLRTTIRQTDLVARWGGEEFIILLVDTQLNNAKLIAEQIRDKLASDKELAEITNTQVTVSLGVTEVKDSDDSNAVFKRVDSALYQAKHSGKNRVVSAV